MRFAPLLCVLLILTAPLSADRGVSDTEVVVGMSTALSGPAQALGQDMRDGVLNCFEQVNAAGGVHGRKLRLVVLDDGYEPKQAAPNMRALVEKENVFAVIGNVGTPTAIVAIPIANETKTLLMGAFTGAGVLRKAPPDRYVVNFRASYAQETAAMVKGLCEEAGYKPAEFAFFTQNDGYGDAGYAGGMSALKAAGFPHPESLPHGRYERNTTNVEEALATIAGAETPPRAVIMVGAYAPCAAFIKQAKELGLEALFLNVSFVGSQALARELGAEGDGVVVTQCVPLFTDESVPAVKEFRAHVKHGTPGFVTLEGYLAARTFVLGLERCGRELTREKHIDALAALGEFDLGVGAPLSLGPGDHQACDAVWPTIIRNGEFKPLRWAELKK